jgi:hypothetical protein
MVRAGVADHPAHWVNGGYHALSVTTSLSGRMLSQRSCIRLSKNALHKFSAP